MLKNRELITILQENQLWGRDWGWHIIFKDTLYIYEVSIITKVVRKWKDVCQITEKRLEGQWWFQEPGVAQENGNLDISGGDSSPLMRKKWSKYAFVIIWWHPSPLNITTLIHLNETTDIIMYYHVSLSVSFGLTIVENREDLKKFHFHVFFKYYYWFLPCIIQVKHWGRDAG